MWSPRRLASMQVHAQRMWLQLQFVLWVLESALSAAASSESPANPLRARSEPGRGWPLGVQEAVSRKMHKPPEDVAAFAAYFLDGAAVESHKRAALRLRWSRCVWPRTWQVELLCPLNHLWVYAVMLSQ